MKVAIFGSLNISVDQENKVLKLLEEEFTALRNPSNDYGRAFSILSGGATGVQSVIPDFVHVFGYDLIVFKPWTQVSRKLEKQATSSGKFDPIYFFFRNIQIVDNADIVLIFDTGDKCAEVDRVRELCERKNKTVKEFNI